MSQQYPMRRFALPLIVAGILVSLMFAAVHPAYAAQSTGSTSQAKAALVAAQDVTGGDAAVASPVVSKAAVKARAYVQDSGWKGWAKSGKTAGTATSKGLRSLNLKLTGRGDLSGTINYRVYDKGLGWGKTKAAGASTGRTSTPIQAVKIWLTGDLATHYDVLYRIRIVSKGWQPWVKNKTKAGIAGSNAYATAVQVKLSPKTEAAAGNGANAVGVLYESSLVGTGWKPWVADGKTAGTASAKKTSDRFAARVDAGDIAGGIQYRGYIQGKKWTGWAAAGKAVGTTGKRLESLKIKLTGDLASQYDVYYRTYVPGYKWLGWAKNGAEAGARGYSLPIAAVQVKLVKQGEAAPSQAKGATVAENVKALNGIDISSWQQGLDPRNVQADFIIVKATQSTNYTNPYFKKWADAVLASGKLLGAYHFAVKGDATKQADYFVKVVGPYVGKCALFLDWEDTSTSATIAQGPSWAEKFMDRVYKKTGVRPLIYMSESVTREYDWDSTASKYGLWVANWMSKNMKSSGYTVNPARGDGGCGPWDGPTVFQYSDRGHISGYAGDLDLNVFYGNRTDWAALAAAS